MNHKRLLLEQLIRLQWYGMAVTHPRVGFRYCAVCHQHYHGRRFDRVSKPSVGLIRVRSVAIWQRTHRRYPNQVIDWQDMEVAIELQGRYYRACQFCASNRKPMLIEDYVDLVYFNNYKAMFP